ncbi:Clp protease N-terminal domain-containing protein [Spirillospora sp. NPDC047279]|uniref:Clp protease N-terminal domain-containing protein n=1 Tax=Spirillospora sp. NPDC047279 TaxID=3155478 RepID=UPI0033C5CDD3
MVRVPERDGVLEALNATKVCLNDAFLYGWRRGHDRIGTAHLLLALAAQGDPVGNRILVEAGVTYAALDDLLSREAWRKANAEPPDADGSLRGLPSAYATRRPSRPARRREGRRPGPPGLPRPRWTTTLRAATGGGVGRGHNRAAQLLALLGDHDTAARAAVADLGVRPDRLRERIADAHGPRGPRRFGDLDGEMRSAGYVLARTMRCEPYDRPGLARDWAWRDGLAMTTLARVAGREPHHVLAGILTVYEELRADAAQFGAGWEACFPAARPLVESEMTSMVAGPPRRPLLDVNLLTRLARQGRRTAAVILEGEPPREGRFTVELVLIGALAQESPALDALLDRFGLDRHRVTIEVAQALSA